MSKTSIALLVMFIIALGTLIAMNTLYSTNPALNSLPNLFPTQEVKSENVLSITPDALKVTAGKPTILNIQIDSRGEKPTLVQMELSYNPAAISSVSLMPGTFFQNPEVFLNKVNARNGRISYALGPKLGKVDATNSPIVATIKIIPRLNSKKETTLTFLPKTIVQTKSSKNSLKTARGTTLYFSSLLAPVASSSGALR